VVTFFGLFGGIRATEDRLKAIITYCYAFIVFSLSASVLPFFALPLIPQLYEAMTKSPIGIVAGCSVAAEIGDPAQPRTDDTTIPRELRCNGRTEQWVVNIGGTTSSTDSSPYRLVRISGGLVVPLYAVVLSLMGAAVSMTRRVPEYQRRLSPSDPEYLTYDEAREGLVFQIMQVASAPLIAITAYYLVDPGSKAGTIVLSFASGFSSETVLLVIRAIMEKIAPTSPSRRSRKSSVVVAPMKVDFGTVATGSSAKQSVSVSNPGPAALTVTSLKCDGEFSSRTSVPFTVAPNSNSAIELEFKPVSADQKQGLLTIADNATGSPRTVELTGVGT
jgi:hypothetical protein